MPSNLSDRFGTIQFFSLTKKANKLNIWQISLNFHTHAQRFGEVCSGYLELRDKSQLPSDSQWVCLVFVGNSDVQMRTH